MEIEHKAARLFTTRVQLVEDSLQFFEFLAGFAEFAFGREALVVGEVSGGFGNESVEIGRGRCPGGGR